MLNFNFYQLSLMLLLSLLLSSSFHPCYSLQIKQNGAWNGVDVDGQHYFDAGLAKGLEKFLKIEEAKDVVDFGCGLGDYVKYLSKSGIPTDGFDGNPFTHELSGGVCHVLDLSVPFTLNKTYDWVISLEVGEHLPKQFETVFIENLVAHCTTGIVLSWAVEGQPGFGHYNCRNNDYIKARLESYGFKNDVYAEKILREKSTLYWFKNTIMVFRKI